MVECKWFIFIYFYELIAVVNIWLCVLAFFSYRCISLYLLLPIWLVGYPGRRNCLLEWAQAIANISCNAAQDCPRLFARRGTKVQCHHNPSALNSSVSASISPTGPHLVQLLHCDESPCMGMKLLGVVDCCLPSAVCCLLFFCTTLITDEASSQACSHHLISFQVQHVNAFTVSF